MNLTTEQLREIVEAVKPTDGSLTLEVTIAENLRHDSGLFCWCRSGGLVLAYTGPRDAYNACLVALVERMKEDVSLGMDSPEFHVFGYGYEPKGEPESEAAHSYGANRDPLLALWQAFQARPDLFAEASR